MKHHHLNPLIVLFAMLFTWWVDYLGFMHGFVSCLSLLWVFEEHPTAGRKGRDEPTPAHPYR